MKKLLVSLLLACVSLSSVAQDEAATEKYSVSTNSFWHNWFIQVNANWNVWYGNYEDGQGWSKSPFESFRSTPSASFAVGKWFTPGIGLRTKISGVWGRAVFSEDKDVNDNKYWILNEHILLNLSNIFCGYNGNRVWNFISFLGGGVGRSCTYDEYAMGFSVGILNEFRVSRRLDINLEVGWNCYESDICGMPPELGSGILSKPNNVYAEVGLTVNLGRTGWRNTPDVDAITALSQSQLDALNAVLADERAENERLNNALAEREKASAAHGDTVFASYPVSVFFNINKAVPASKKELVNVKSIADFAIANGLTLVVTGYADSATGSVDFNRELSRRRAERIADELVDMGVPRDRIITDAMGGVDTLIPPSYNRRVIIEIAR